MVMILHLKQETKHWPTSSTNSSLIKTELAIEYWPNTISFNINCWYSFFI